MAYSSADVTYMPTYASAMDLDAAESPLAAAEHPQVKHSFVHMRLAADWLAYPLDIDVNKSLQASVNGGEWHGSAAYFTDEGGHGIWNLTFRCKADTSVMKTTRYRQIQGTSTYLCQESTSSNQFNCMLVVKNV